MKGLVLISDDEVIMRCLIQDILEDEGYEVLVTENGQEAVDLFAKSKDDISFVILDVIMPVMDGVTAFHKIRELKSNAKILFSTGYHDDQKIDEFVKDEEVHLLQKPFRANQLLSAIQELIDS